MLISLIKEYGIPVRIHKKYLYSTTILTVSVVISHYQTTKTSTYICIVFVHTELNVKTVLFQTIQFNITTQFSSIWPIDTTLSGATTLGQIEPGSDGNEGVHHIPQSSSSTGTSPSDSLMSYPGHSLCGGSYSNAEMPSVYSTAPADWALVWLNNRNISSIIF